MDLVVRAPRLPRPGETLLGEASAMSGGGKGANQAVAAARLGAGVAMVGRVGYDAFGHALRDGLAAEGIDVTCVERAERPSGVALITVDRDGENTIVVAPGANAALLPAHLARDTVAGAAVANAEWLVVQLESPLDTVREALRRAQAAGTRCLLNAAPATPLDDELLAALDVLVVNRGEGESLASMPAGTDAPALARALSARGPGLVVVTLGADGAVAIDGEGRLLQQPPFAVRAVDSTAAGDAFVGALATALLEQQDVEAALRFASAAGALATTRAGAQDSLPTRAEVEALLASA